jgi:TRAP-type C4-dicarboxylate transport system permease small subunit
MSSPTALIRDAAARVALGGRLKGAMLWLESGALYASIGLLACLLVLMNIEVVARYGLGKSTLVADEFGGYIYACIVMLGGVHLLRSERYLTMSALLNKAGPRVQLLARYLRIVIGFFVSAVCLYATLLLTISSYRFGTVSIQPSATPLVLPQVVLPLGFAILCFAYVDELLRQLRGDRARSDEPASTEYGVGEVP